MLPLPAPIQAAINHVLGQAAWAREKLMPFAGHAAQIKLPPFEAAFLITPDGSIAAPEAGAELEVAISLPATTPLLALQGKDAVMRAARIEGSAEFAQALGFVIRNLRWDAEEDLSRLVGDVAAHRIVKGRGTTADRQAGRYCRLLGRHRPPARRRRAAGEAPAIDRLSAAHGAKASTFDASGNRLSR